MIVAVIGLAVYPGLSADLGRDAAQALADTRGEPLRKFEIAKPETSEWSQPQYLIVTSGTLAFLSDGESVRAVDLTNVRIRPIRTDGPR